MTLKALSKDMSTNPLKRAPINYNTVKETLSKPPSRNRILIKDHKLIITKNPDKFNRENFNYKSAKLATSETKPYRINSAPEYDQEDLSPHEEDTSQDYDNPREITDDDQKNPS